MLLFVSITLQRISLSGSAEIAPRTTINSSVISAICTYGLELLNPPRSVARLLSPTPSGAHYGPQKRRLSCLRINFRPKQWTPLDQHQTRPADYWRQSDISAVWGNLKESEPENQNFRFQYIVQLSLCHACIKYHERWVSNMFYAPFIIPFKPCYNLSPDWQFMTCFINHYEYIRMPWESERQRKCGRILLSLMVKNHIKG